MRNENVDRYFTEIGKNPEYEASAEGEKRSNGAYAKMSAKFKKAEDWGYDTSNITFAAGQVVFSKKETHV